MADFKKIFSSLSLASCMILLTGCLLAGCTQQGAPAPPEVEDELKTFTPDEFDEIVAQDKLVLLKFGATWCGPCRQVDKELAAIKPSLPSDVEIVKIDVDANPDLASDLSISSIPRMLLLRNSELVADKTGYMSRQELADWIDAHR